MSEPVDAPPVGLSVVVFYVAYYARVEGLIIAVCGGECCVSRGFGVVDVLVVCPESAGWVPVAYGLHSGSDESILALSIIRSAL